jgi:hypothetical protein
VRLVDDEAPLRTAFIFEAPRARTISRREVSREQLVRSPGKETLIRFEFTHATLL